MGKEHIRQDVFNRLTKAGWITSSWVKDVGEATQFKVVYTELGKVNMRSLFNLYAELGYHKHYITGELDFLLDLVGLFEMEFRDKPEGSTEGEPPPEAA